MAARARPSTMAFVKEVWKVMGKNTAQTLSLLWCLVLAACATAPAPAPLDPAPEPATPLPQTSLAELQAAIDVMAQPVVERGWIKGMAIAFVHPSGTAVMGYGQGGEGQGRPGPDTVFEIGSVTKVFTALLLADLVAQGAAELHTPVAALLPQTMSVPTFQGREITLLDLATHRSALPRLPTNFAPADPENPYLDFGMEQVSAFLAEHVLSQAPGTQALYSNLGTGLLGFAVAKHWGGTYEAVLRERILGPLGLEDTGIALSAAQAARLIQGHDENGRAVPPWDFGALEGAGALRSTPADMLRFLQLCLGGVASPLAPVIDRSMAYQGPFDNAHSMGLGWLISAQGQRWHDGMTGGYYTFVAIDPQAQVGVVLLANTRHPIAQQMGWALIRLLAGEPYRFELPQEIVLGEEILRRYVGRYVLGPGVSLTVTLEDGALMAQITGQSALRLYPEEETLFDYRVLPAKIQFVVEDDGTVTGLLLRQGGREIPAERAAE